MAKLSLSFEAGAMCIAGRGLEGDGGERQEWGGGQTGDFAVRWLLPLKLSACHCSLMLVTTIPSSLRSMEFGKWSHPNPFSTLCASDNSAFNRELKHLIVHNF